MHVFMYTYMCEPMYVYFYACMFVFKICMHACIFLVYICMFVHASIYVHLCLYLYACNACMHANISINQMPPTITALGEGGLAKMLDTGRWGQKQCQGKAAFVRETLLLRNTAFEKHLTPFLSTYIYAYIYIYTHLWSRFLSLEKHFFWETFDTAVVHVHIYKCIYIYQEREERRRGQKRCRVFLQRKRPCLASQPAKSSSPPPFLLPALSLPCQ